MVTYKVGADYITAEVESHISVAIDDSLGMSQHHARDGIP